jgi:hypothetical protein
MKLAHDNIVNDNGETNNWRYNQMNVHGGDEWINGNYYDAMMESNSSMKKESTISYLIKYKH